MQVLQEARPIRYPELALQAFVSYLMWVLGIELRDFAREVHVLNC